MLRGLHLQSVVLDFHHRLPIEPGRVAQDINARLRGAVEHDVEPVILAQPLRGLVFMTGSSLPKTLWCYARLARLAKRVLSGGVIRYPIAR